MQDQKVLVGSLDEKGHPTLKIRVYGISSDHSAEFTAMIDTGFTGFLTLPLVAAIPLGLTLFGTNTSVYANGETGTSLLAVGTVVFGENQPVVGPISLSSGDQPLLGMGFLRISGRAILLLSSGFTLFDESWLLEQMKSAATSSSQSAKAGT